jgi:predicted RNA-binding Zn-ribbon protein involved in translation (DUF1610 family)
MLCQKCKKTEMIEAYKDWTQTVYRCPICGKEEVF